MNTPLAIPITLSDAEPDALLTWSQPRKMAQALALSTRIILAAKRGLTNAAEFGYGASGGCAAHRIIEYAPRTPAEPGKTRSTCALVRSNVAAMAPFSTARVSSVGARSRPS